MNSPKKRAKAYHVRLKKANQKLTELSGLFKTVRSERDVLKEKVEVLERESWNKDVEMNELEQKMKRQHKDMVLLQQSSRRQKEKDMFALAEVTQHKEALQASLQQVQNLFKAQYTSIDGVLKEGYEVSRRTDGASFGRDGDYMIEGSGLGAQTTRGVLVDSPYSRSIIPASSMTNSQSSLTVSILF